MSASTFPVYVYTMNADGSVTPLSDESGIPASGSMSDFARSIVQSMFGGSSPSASAQSPSGASSNAPTHSANKVPPAASSRAPPMSASNPSQQFNNATVNAVKQAQELANGRFVPDMQGYVESCEFDTALAQHKSCITQLEEQLSIVRNRHAQLTIAQASQKYGCIHEFEVHRLAQNVVDSYASMQPRSQSHASSQAPSQPFATSPSSSGGPDAKQTQVQYYEDAPLCGIPSCRRQECQSPPNIVTAAKPVAGVSRGIASRTSTLEQPLSTSAPTRSEPTVSCGKDGCTINLNPSSIPSSSAPPPPPPPPPRPINLNEYPRSSLSSRRSPIFRDESANLEPPTWRERPPLDFFPSGDDSI